MLYSRSEARALLGWRREAVKHFEDRVSDEHFPCIFARNSYKRYLTTHAFLNGKTDEEFRLLYEEMRFYAKESKSWDQKVNSSSPLIVHFSHDVYLPTSVESDSFFG